MQFIRGAAGLKVKEVPSYVSKYANEHWQPAILQRRLTTWMNGYKKDHIDTGSIKPLFDVCGYGFVFSYAFSWPTEYAHLKAAEAAKLKGEKGHH